MTRAAVLGSGAWGTTFAAVLGDAGNDVVVWSVDADAVAEINEHHTNAAFCGDRVLPDSVRATVDAREAIVGASSFSWHSPRRASGTSSRASATTSSQTRSSSRS